jgi:hypothetical protein
LSAQRALCRYRSLHGSEPRYPLSECFYQADDFLNGFAFADDVQTLLRDDLPELLDFGAKLPFVPDALNLGQKIFDDDGLEQIIAGPFRKESTAPSSVP